MRWLSLKAISTSKMTKNTKRKGYIYEQIFFTEALKNGLEVFCPLGDHLPVDCIVVNSAGRKFNVQIKGSEKSSVSERKNGCARYKFSTTTGRVVKYPLDCTKVDVVAIFCADIDAWYLIPCLAIDGALTVAVYPHNPNSKGKHEKYREAWEIFKTAWKIFLAPCHNGMWRTISVRRKTQECEL